MTEDELMNAFYVSCCHVPMMVVDIRIREKQEGIEYDAGELIPSSAWPEIFCAVGLVSRRQKTNGS